MKYLRNSVVTLLTFSLALCISVGSVAQSQTEAQTQALTQGQPTLPTVPLTINGVTLKTEIAKTGMERYMGLSFRKSLANDAAMLFVYPSEQQLTFTMRNTLIPLSIAYLSKDLVINEIHLMPVGPNQLFPSKRHAQYALEVNQGWFKQHGIAVGDQVTLR